MLKQDWKLYAGSWTCCNIYGTTPSRGLERFVDDVYSILKRTHLQNFFYHINNFYQNIKFTNEEPKFLDTLLKPNNGKISALAYRKPRHTDQYLHYNSYKESDVSSLFKRGYSIITNKDYSTKEESRIKQVLKKNGYRESTISKIFKRITNNHSLSQSQQLTQATNILVEKIKMSINLAYVEGTSEKLLCILKSHKIRSTFYIESTLRKLLCKLKDWVATEDKNIVVYETDYSNCEAVHFGESKQSLISRSDEHKGSAKNCGYEKNETAKHCWETNHSYSWDQKKVIDRESRLIPTKIKETIHFLKNSNHIKKIYYMLPWNYKTNRNNM